MVSRRSTTRSRGRPTGPRWNRSRRFNLFALATLIISAGLLVLTLLQREDESSATPGALDHESIATFAVLDVGQALSAVIVTEDGYSMVYDFGISGANTHEVIIPFLEDHGVSEIDYAVLSHPHQDHLGGFPQLLDSMPIAHYIDPVIETTNQTYGHSLERIERYEIEASIARQGDTYSLGELVELEILWPADEFVMNPDGTPDVNDNSTVIRADVGKVSILLTGDNERESERILSDTLAAKIDVDILLVGHHGSNTSSQDYFLEATSPDLAVISAGADNQYGHPHTEVMQRLRQHDIQIYRTDVDGTVIIQTDGETWDVTGTRTEQSWSNLDSSSQSTILNVTSAVTNSLVWSSMMASN
jgi:competence protein ComEC